MARTKAKSSSRLVMMHKERFVRYCQTEFDMTTQDAVAKWEKTDRNATEAERDEQGPSHSKNSNLKGFASAADLLLTPLLCWVLVMSLGGEESPQAYKVC